MAVRHNPDGSITVGILKDEPKEEKPEVKAGKPKRAKKQPNGEG